MVEFESNFYILCFFILLRLTSTEKFYNFFLNFQCIFM